MSERIPERARIDAGRRAGDREPIRQQHVDSTPGGAAPGRVVHCKREKYDVYIGRPSKWGNPFTLTQALANNAQARDRVIAQYREWIKTQPELLAALPELRGKVLAQAMPRRRAAAAVQSTYSGTVKPTTGFEGFVFLLPWGRIDHEEGTVVLKVRWFQWGYSTRRGEPNGWYILIRLPSYLMKQAWIRWDVEPTWHQRCLLFKGNLPAGDEGWKVIELECE